MPGNLVVQKNGPAVRMDPSDGSFPPTPKPFMATDIAGCGKKVIARALAPTDSTPPIHTIPAWEKKITYGPGTLDTVLVSPVPLHYKRA